MPRPPPLVFLSHSGADTKAALELKRLLESSPEARKAGLKVWFDKDDLRPGTPWSAQIAGAIQTLATAFVVYVGSGGVMNWVEAEVDLAISRATTDKQNPLLFIPALAAKSAGSKALPPFAKRYQGVRDPLGDCDELTKLLRAVLSLDWDASPVIIDEPYVGLRSMREEESDRFFGRDAEVKDLVEKFRKHRLVAIVADSGTGKSSLAQAGFIPAFRGGALIDPIREDAREKIWQVVTMRPGADPVAGLRQGVTEAAEKLGRSLDERASLRKQVSVDDASETAYALQCGLPLAKTSTLLIVDQFEELFTTTPEKEAADFARLLVGLADGPSDVRVLITVRADYFNLASGIKDTSGKSVLFDRLTAENNSAILRLKAMPSKGIKAAVCKPLLLAGEGDEAANQALLEAVQSDISHHASDLPLLQVALRAAWQEHKATGRPMLESYQSVGRVSGALAREADNARDRLPQEDQARLESIFVRLVRLGDTGGATRRTAALDEFDEARRKLVQRLGQDEYGRLVSVGETTAEIAHEALITQWPWLAARLNANGGDVRRLDRLTTKSQEWIAAPAVKRLDYLATGAERELFGELAEQRPTWLSAKEKDFVVASNKAHQEEVEAAEREQARKLDDARKIMRRTGIGLVVALVLAAATSIFGFYAHDEQTKAQAALWLMESQSDLASGKTQQAVQTAAQAMKVSPSEVSRSALLVALANISPNLLGAVDSSSDTPTALAWTDPVTGTVATTSGKILYFVAGSLPSRPHWTTQSLVDVQREGAVVVELKRLPDGDTVIVYSDSAIGVVRKLATKIEIYEPETSGKILSLPHKAAISRSGAYIAITSIDNGIISLRCDWQTVDAQKACRKQDSLQLSSNSEIGAVGISPDERHVAFGDQAGNVDVCDAASNTCRTTASPVGDQILSLDWAPDGKRIALGTLSGKVIVIDSDLLVEVTRASAEKPVSTLAWGPTATELASICDGNMICLWALPNSARGTALRLVGRFIGHRGTVVRIAWSPNETMLASTSADGEILVWSATQDRNAIYALPPCQATNFETLAVSRDSFNVAAGGTDGIICVWSAAGDLLETFIGPSNSEVISLAWSKGGLLAALRMDGTLENWSIGTGQPASLPRLPTEIPSRVVWGNDDLLLVVTASDASVAFVDPKDPSKPPQLVKYISGSDGVSGMAVRPGDDLLFSSYTNNAIGMIDLHTRKLLGSISASPSSSGSLSLSPDGRFLAATGSDYFVSVYDIGGRKVQQKIPVDVSETRAVAFSPDGRRLAALGDNVLYIWDMSPLPPKLFERLDFRSTAMFDRTQRNAQLVKWLGWLATDRITVATSDGMVLVINLNEDNWHARIRNLGPDVAN